VTELDEYVFRNMAASAYSLTRVLIGSRGEAYPKSRKRNRKARVQAKDHIGLLLKVIITDRTFVYSSTTSVSGKPLTNTDLPTRHGKQRFYWPWRRSPPWFTRYTV